MRGNHIIDIQELKQDLTKIRDFIIVLHDLKFIDNTVVSKLQNIAFSSNSLIILEGSYSVIKASRTITIKDSIEDVNFYDILAKVLS